MPGILDPEEQMKHAAQNIADAPLKCSKSDNAIGADESDASVTKNGTVEEKAIEEKDGEKEAPVKESSKEKIQSAEDVPLKIFTIKLLIPGAPEPSVLQISNHDTVQEIRQVVLDRPESCFRTCFSLHFNGNRLDDFVELHTIEDIGEDSIVKVVDEPYSVREARIHIRRLRDLLSTSLYQSSFTATDNLSLSLYSTIAGLDPEEEILKGNKDSNIPTEECKPPSFSFLDQGTCPLIEPMIPDCTDPKTLQCIKELKFSSWNPPPGPRKLAGELLYLDVVTLEENKYCITSSSNGFYVNRSSDAAFDPKPHSEPCRGQTLVGLLSQLSPLFKKNFAALQRQSIKKHPLEVVPSPYQVYPWLTPMFEHTADPFRAEDAVTSRIGYEEQIPGQLRDWNEELQSAKELPKKSTHQRILRERAMYKITSDFVATATKGAMAVVDGNVMAINPGEEEKLRMYIWNNIFFSFACDSRDHYRRFGGDAAAYSAAGSDLRGVKAFNRLDIEGLYTLGTVIVDYRGYRVIAQSIIPGILQREQENSVVYGSIDGGKTISGNEKFLELLKTASETLRTRTHKILNEKEDEIELCSSMECKGIIGADGRHYVLDLFRTFPPDTNFVAAAKEITSKKDEIGEENKNSNGSEIENDQKSSKAKIDKQNSFEFPSEYAHELCTIRQNIVDAFVGFRYVLFLKLIALYNQQQRTAKKEKDANEDKKAIESEASKLDDNDENTIDSGEDKESQDDKNDNKTDAANDAKLTEDINKIAENIAKEIDPVKEAKQEENADELTMQAVKQAATTVGSLQEKEFEIRFNPDVYVAEVQHADSEKKNLEKDKVLVKDLSKFLSDTVVPKMIEDFITLSLVPLDGIALTEAMHARGVNMRYLGKIAFLCSLRNDLEHIYRIAVSEMILRTAKKQIKSCLQSATLRTLSAAVSHFLNCFLSSFAAPQPHLPPEENIKKKKNKKKGKNSQYSSNNQIAWVALSPSVLWEEIKKEMKAHFGFELQGVDIDSIEEKYQIQRVSLLRGVCKKAGVQLQLREYDFLNKKHLTFTEDDVINIFPVVKHVEPIANDGNALFEVAQGRLQAGMFSEAHDLMLESLNIFNQVYGPLHSDIVICYRTIARLYYIADDVSQAVAYQKKAVIVCERVFGIDHPETIMSYVHLALYCYSAGLVAASLKLMYRARYLAVIIYGEGHPDLATFDTNIGLMLHSQREFELSLSFLERALKVHLKYYGTDSVQTATIQHLVARAQCCTGNYRSAINNEKATYAVYKKMFGEDDSRTKESSEYLKQTTHRAVTMQKTINEISGKSAGRQVTPPKGTATKVSDESYDKEILGVINKIGTAAKVASSSGYKMVVVVPENRQSCRDSAGKTIQNGKPFSLFRGDSCVMCSCVEGKSKRCITVKCPRPTCDDYRTVPGKCCEYTCPNALPISDTKQLAIVLSLSISLLIILILIVIVWLKARKYKRFSRSTRTECSEQEPLNSIPNNQRQSMSMTSSSGPSRTTVQTVQLPSQEPPPYAPPKNTDPETITPCEPPPPYTPQELTYV
eukprot:gene14402-15902_t